MPEISVIIPAFNMEEHLSRCVESVLVQTYSDFELFLVDDGAADMSSVICDLFAGKDQRVIVIHKENGGLSTARNAGIVAANGKRLSFIDSDDWIHSRYLEWLLEAAVKNDLRVAIGSMQIVSEFMEDIEDVEPSVSVISTEKYWSSHRTNATVACGKLIEKELYGQSFFPKGRLHEDEYTTYKLLFESKVLAVVDTPIYYYYQNEYSITRKEWTEGRCDAICALDGQRKYFLERGLTDLAEYTTVIYERVVYSCMMGARETGNADLSRKLKALLKLEVNSRPLPSADVLRRYDAVFLSVAPARTRLRLYRDLISKRLKKA